MRERHPMLWYQSNRSNLQFPPTVINANHEPGASLNFGLSFPHLPLAIVVPDVRVFLTALAVDDEAIQNG